MSVSYTHLFNYASDDALQRQRTVFPLPYYNRDTPSKIEEEFWKHDYLFTKQNYYTLLFDKEEDCLLYTSIELIPAIDIIDGKCVRLSQGAYDSKKVYNENPVEVALELEAHGIRRLHVVDLDGAASHHVVNYRTLEQIAVRTSLDVYKRQGLEGYGRAF